jgi:iron complex outermembrane receptor protein
MYVIHKSLPGGNQMNISILAGRRIFSAAAFATLSIFCATQAVQAQEAPVEEITVTATKRASTIKDVPFSINAQTQEDIQASGATNLEELSRNVAGLTVQNLGPGQSQVAIRGVSAGQIVRDQPGVKEQVGVYLDESVISLSLFTPDLDLFDLNRVETLRGPQGTLYGSGSVGGTIRYITNQPDLEAFGGMVEGDVNSITDGETGGHVKGVINLPFADGKAAIRAVGYVTQYGGFIDALGENGSRTEDVNSGTRSGGRVALRWEPTDTFAITPRVVYQEITTDGFNRQESFNLYANPYTTTRPAIQLQEREQYLLGPEEFSDETLIADITLEWGIGAADLTYNGAYTERDILVSRDASALTGSVSVDLGYPDAGVLLYSNLQDTTHIEQTTHELRLSSNSDGRWQWLAGAFFSNTERLYAQRLPTPGYQFFTDLTQGAGTSAAVANGFPDLNSPFNSDLPYDLDQTAIFGEVSFDITDQFQLTVGGRWYDYSETRSITTGGLFANGDTGVVDKTSADGFTPRVMAKFDMNENVTFNAQASQGFRLGGVNDPLNPALCTPADRLIFGGFQSYEDETLWNYELGVKTRYNNGLSFNAALFHTQIDNLQVTLDAGSCSSRVSFNVEDSHTTGVELELSATPSDRWLLTLALSALEAEFDATVTDAVGNVLGGVEDGNRLASVPDFQAAATATYTIPVSMMGANDMYFTGTYQHVGDRITQPSDQVAGAGNFTSGLPYGGATGNEVTSVNLLLSSYQLLNLRAGLAWDRWDAVLYVDNVADETTDLSFDRERGGRARLGFRTNQPRTIGLTARWSF